MIVNGIVAPLVRSIVKDLFSRDGEAIDPSFFIQDTQTRWLNLNFTPFTMTNEGVDENDIIYISSTTDVTINTPILPVPNFGGRYLVYNPNGVNVTITGNRNSSVNRTLSVTTNAEQFIIKNNESDTGSFYVDYSIITTS